jgi:hypothetical protein
VVDAAFRVHPAPRSGEGGPPRRGGGRGTPLHHAGAWSPSPAPFHFAGEENHSVLAARHAPRRAKRGEGGDASSKARCEPGEGHFVSGPQNRGNAPSPDRLRCARRSTLSPHAGRGEDRNRVLAVRLGARVLLTTTPRKNLLELASGKQRGRRSVKRRTVHDVRATPAGVAARRCCQRGARHADKSTPFASFVRARGALAFRRSAAALASAVATTSGSAPDPGFPRQAKAKVFCPPLPFGFRHFAAVKRAPRGPVLVPVDRCPRAARGRGYESPRAGTASCSINGRHR